MTKHSVEIAGKTDVGCVRQNNEDNLAIDEQLGLLVVADGMGGHNAGEVASQIAVETILDFARKYLGGEKEILPPGGNPELSPRARQLEFFVKHANSMIFAKGREIAKDRGMGTTLVAALVDDESMTVAHVGDSRLYLWRNNHLEAMTEDHSLVNDQVRRGLITPEEASKSAIQNILTRALGTEENVAVDVADHPLLPGDVLLLASDGLMKMVSDAEVCRVVGEEGEPVKIVDKLIEMSKAAGGVDNVTVVAARVPPKKAPTGIGGLMNKIFGN